MSSERSPKHGKPRKKYYPKKTASPVSMTDSEISATAKITDAETSLEQSNVPYDEKLLERSRNQWHLGDWKNLAGLTLDSIEHHPDRGKLALLAAVGRLQSGNDEAKEFIRFAQEWGTSNRLISKILVAGLHNSLGRIAALNGKQTCAIKHFESSIAVAATEGDIRSITGARINYQYADLGLVPPQPDSFFATFSSTATLLAPHRFFNFDHLGEYQLGDAWAGNTVNTAIFRHHGILTHQGKQMTAFYVDEFTLRMVQRDLKTSTLQTYDINGEYNLRDAHNSISLGVDRADHIHISYDHHATKLRYRRSIRPNDITDWTDEITMTGKAEDKVTYPTFILPHHGFPLTLLYRDGVHNKGNAYMKTFDENTQSWADHPKPILCGSDSKPLTSNAYWNHPAIGSDGSLHLSFVWRTHTLDPDERVNNINICYAYSLDNGVNWLTSKGQYYQLPITQVNAETVHPVSPGSNLINQCSMALDSNNRPHIVFYADDCSGIPQYQHLRYDGKQWHHQIISRRTQPFALQGGGTLQIPISRPEIVLDRQDNAYIISRGDHSHGKTIASILSAPDYLWSPDSTLTLWAEDLGFAETVIDRERWVQNNVLSLLLQYNEQPNHDIGHQSIQHPVYLVDIKFNYP